MDLQTIRERVQNGNYLVKKHAILHAQKEGFQVKHMVEVILNGRIIETYPDDQRVLICGRSTLLKNIVVYLHVVCEYADPIYIEFVTAYIPDENQWQFPPFSRLRLRRR
ncbi:MAG: DUF4258 domain-containing protein [Candidatus Poribacteria bacterium]|nr:DUF4258 domain-containing protein [Candidatus Poribacteria bacterium]